MRTTRIISLLSLFISLNLAWYALPYEASAQVSPGTWVQFEFLPSKTLLHVTTDSVLRRISDSLRIVRDELAVMPGIHGDGLVDRLAYWVNDSTLSLWLPISQVQTAMHMAAGMRDSSWLGKYDIPSDAWDTPAHVDEPPFPDWFTKDWRKWEKYGLYISPDAPLQMVCHPRGDSVMVFEFKLPKARLLDFLGIDTTTQTELPRIVAYLNGSEATSVTDSGAYLQLQALSGLGWSHDRNIGGDTLTLSLSIDWKALRDSVLLWTAGGGGGATTFTGLTDTPPSYTGKAGQVPMVNPGETALEFGVMPFSGALTNATLVWDTVGVAVDSSCTIYRMEWMPPITAYPLSEPYHEDAVGAHQRIGYVRYRLYINPPETWRSAAGYYSYLLHIVADSTNHAMLGTGRISAMSWDKTPGSSIEDETWSIYTFPGGVPGSYGTGTKYGYATTSSYRGVRPRMAWFYPNGYQYVDSTSGMTGKYQMWQWLSSTHSSSTSRIYGVVDIHLYYKQAHGHNSTYGVKIAKVLYRPMTSDGYLPVDLR